MGEGDEKWRPQSVTRGGTNGVGTARYVPHRSRAATRRRAHWLVPGAILLSVLVVLGAFIFMAVPLPASASYAPSSDGPQVCEHCPSGETGCIPNCGPPPPPCQGASIGSVDVAYQNQSSITRQVWVNWTVGGSGEPTTFFYWYLPGGSDLPSPSYDLSGNSGINLNALTSGTTYDYEVYIENSCGSAVDYGSFGTLGAPTNEFVGWVSEMVQDPYQLDPSGSSIPGASVRIQASCYNISVGIGTYNPTLTSYEFGPYLTSSSGAFAIQFPDYVNYTEVGGEWHVSQILESTGVCHTWLSTIGYPTAVNVENFTNAHYSMLADHPGYWNAALWVSSTLSASNDFVQFGLASKVAQDVPVGTAFVHDGADASCSFTYWTSTQTSTITQNVGINSYGGTDVIATSTQSYNSPGGYADNNALNLEDLFTGLINETPDHVAIVQSSVHATGGQQGVDANPVASSDGVTLISTSEYPPSSQLPIGWNESIPNSGQTQSDPLSEKIYAEGTYESTSGISDSISVSVGWGGVSAGTTVSLLATTSISTSIGTTTSCAFAYPGADPSGNGGYPYFYYFAGEPTDVSVAAPIVDVWFMGYCGGSGGEPAC
jgi:hypothetical protein